MEDVIGSENNDNENENLEKGIKIDESKYNVNMNTQTWKSVKTTHTNFEQKNPCLSNGRKSDMDIILEQGVELFKFNINKGCNLSDSIEAAAIRLKMDEQLLWEHLQKIGLVVMCGPI